MRKLTLTLFLPFLLLCTAQAQSATDSTLIDAYIKGLTAGKVRLVGVVGDQNYLADSTVADASGHFTLRRKTPLPAGFYTWLLPGQKNFSMLVDKDQKFTLRADAADFLNTLKTDYSLNTELLYESFRLQSRQEPELNQLAEVMKNNPPNTKAFQDAKARQQKLVDDRKAALDAMYKKSPDAFFTKFKIAGQNPDPVDFRKPNGDLDTVRQLVDYRSRFWDNVDFSDNRLLYTPVIGNKLKRYIKDLTPQTPDSIISVADALIRRVQPHKEYFKYFSNWIALQYENGKTTVMDGEAVYVYIVKTFFKPGVAYWSDQKELDALQKHVSEMEASLMGRKGLNVTAQDVMDGQMKSIYDMTAPLVVVFMFSPDCEHCQKDAPKISTIANSWKSRGVQFYGIALGDEEKAAEIKEFVRKNRFPFPVVNDPTNRAIYAKYFVDITPELYVLNKDRIIVSKNLHAEQLEEVFEREMRKNK
ncbi:MAG TPA: redoxin domain-containing protein [Saprospiraceae bacterium]|nr:redoxin domain-containing protein [Saprospiraceae bacterium]